MSLLYILISTRIPRNSSKPISFNPIHYILVAIQNGVISPSKTPNGTIQRILMRSTPIATFVQIRNERSRIRRGKAPGGALRVLESLINFCMRAFLVISNSVRVEVLKSRVISGHDIG